MPMSRLHKNHARRCLHACFLTLSLFSRALRLHSVATPHAHVAAVNASVSYVSAARAPILAGSAAKLFAVPHTSRVLNGIAKVRPSMACIAHSYHLCTSPARASTELRILLPPGEQHSYFCRRHHHSDLPISIRADKWLYAERGREGPWRERHSILTSIRHDLMNSGYAPTSRVI